ncbi:MAG TPA: tetratricopeptide repeat protein [Terracidiphilus sp.]|nr:tetratricopeptide repeat protein [Terracidiphilus sp.]
MVDPQLAEGLAAALAQRNLEKGFQILALVDSDIGKVDLNTPGGPALLLLFAQWVDAGYRDYRILDSMLEKFPASGRRILPIEDYLSVRMAESFRDLAANRPHAAISKLELVLTAYSELPGTSQEAVAHFWKGRAHRKKGEYGTALKHIVRAREIAEANHDGFFAAVVQIQESWLQFQKGLSKEALQLLDRAESVLKLTDHYVALGNIESARGRIVRRSGEYSKALEHYERALEIYSRRDPNHVNVARTLVNIGYAQRLLALQLRKRIDRVQSASRSNRARPSAEPRETVLTKYQTTWRSAVDALTRAHAIYVLHDDFDGIGKVLSNLGYVHLDRGDIESAEDEACQAYQIGRRQNDHILMARARILAAAIENAHVEEQTGEDTDVAVHANRARQYSEEALSLAHETQNQRLLAGAAIARGMTAANDFFEDWESARRFASEATALIGPGESDHILEDLAVLKSRIVKASGINDTLRCWSEGIVGDKTFQQITEEFAEIVIPKVWLRSDRRISRVATTLSISPKKVRRILRNSGLISH